MDQNCITCLRGEWSSGRCAVSTPVTPQLRLSLWLTLQEEQVQYLEDSEVDFSSDDDEEDDMEDFAGGDDGVPPAGPSGLGKRRQGMPICSTFAQWWRVAACATQQCSITLLHVRLTQYTVNADGTC